jgi:hypothetical protein
MAEEYDKEISIYEEDAETIIACLNSVYHYCLSYDLFTQYRSLSNNVQRAPITKQVERVRNRVQSILDEHEASKATTVEGDAEEDVPEELGVS